MRDGWVLRYPATSNVGHPEIERHSEIEKHSEIENWRAGQRRPVARLIVGAALLFIVSSCGVSQQTASRACAQAAADLGSDFAVVASFASNVGDIRSIHHLTEDPELFESLPAATSATLCYIDGPFAKSGPVLEDGSVPESFDRAALAVVDQKVEFVLIGRKEALPATAP